MVNSVMTVTPVNLPWSTCSNQHCGTHMPPELSPSRGRPCYCTHGLTSFDIKEFIH